jgi:ABC-type phosphate/phosphonate transport system substrate-binding protein
MSAKEKLTMRRNATCPTLVLSATVLLCATGCQTLSSRFLSLMGLSKDPLALALAMDNSPAAPVEALNPFPRYAALQKALGDGLGRPVAVDVCFLFQADLGLTSGLYDVADVTTTQYARLTRPETLRVLAVPADQQGRIARCAVLVVAANSPIQGVPGLRGKIVAFGPADDPRTHHAALHLLQREGLAKTDLALEVLPVLGGLKHMPDARSVAQTVASGGSDAGFIDEAAWDALPEHAPPADEPARDKLRIIGRTAPVPDRVIVASPKLPAETADKVSALLLAMECDHPDALKPLGIAGFGTPDADAAAAWRKLILPAEPPPEEPESADQSATESAPPPS